MSAITTPRTTPTTTATTRNPKSGSAAKDIGPASKPTASHLEYLTQPHPLPQTVSASTPRSSSPLPASLPNRDDSSDDDDTSAYASAYDASQARPSPRANAPLTLPSFLPLATAESTCVPVPIMTPPTAPEAHTAPLSDRPTMSVDTGTGAGAGAGADVDMQDVAVQGLEEPSMEKLHRNTTTTTEEIDSTITKPGSVKINVKGAFIVDPDTSTPKNPPGSGNGNGRGSPTHHETSDIRLPNHTAVVSHIAVDVS